jgi:WD40 repeat protein
MRTYPIDTRAVDVKRGRIAIGKKERPPGRIIPTARAAFVWDAATGKALAGPLVNELYFEVAEFSPDGKVLAVVPRTTTNPLLTEGAVNFWEVETGKLLGSGAVTTDLDDRVQPAFRPDGKLLAAGSIDGRVLVFDVPSGKLVSPLDLNHNDPVRKSSWRWIRAVAFSPDGKLLATAGMDTRVCLWDVRTWEPRGVFHHPGKAMSVAFAPHGRELITGCGDGLARRWDIATGTQVGDVLAEKGTIWAVAEQPAGAYRAVARDFAIQLWDRDTSHRVGPAYPHRVATIMRLEFSKDERTLHAWWAGGGRIIDLPRPVGGDPALIRLHAEVTTGFELLPNGETRALDMQTWLKRNAELKRSGFNLRGK